MGTMGGTARENKRKAGKSEAYWGLLRRSFPASMLLSRPTDVLRGKCDHGKLGECGCLCQDVSWWVCVCACGNMVLLCLLSPSQTWGVFGGESGRGVWVAATPVWVFLFVEEDIGILQSGHRKGISDVFNLFVIHVEPLVVVVAVSSVMTTSSTEAMVADGCMYLILTRLDGDPLVDAYVTRQLVAIVWELFQVWFNGK